MFSAPLLHRSGNIAGADRIAKLIEDTDDPDTLAEWIKAARRYRLYNRAFSQISWSVFTPLQNLSTFNSNAGVNGIAWLMAGMFFQSPRAERGTLCKDRLMLRCSRRRPAGWLLALMDIAVRKHTRPRSLRRCCSP